MLLPLRQDVSSAVAQVNPGLLSDRRIWGEPIPLPAINHRTQNDWKFVKGHIEYVEMGHHWVLLRFANAQDEMLVFDKRPYFVNGLNFVLKPWVVFFDPYVFDIDRVDQWVRIPRLPWEF